MVEAAPITHPAQGAWTYDDYLALPDDGNRYEIIEGVLYMVNAPGYDHQFAVVQLIKKIGAFVDEHHFGEVLTAPFEVHLSERTRPVQPDVLVIRATDQLAANARFFAGAPALVVEVMSPSSVRTDQVIKFSAYEAAAVPEYWLVNPKTRSVEVFTLSGGEYALLGQYTDDEVIASKVLAGLAITTSTLFVRNTRG